MRTIRGKRIDNDTLVQVCEDSVVQRPLPHIVRHSPTGFEWGYGGSGPADLALSILGEVEGSLEIADCFYMLFKADVVARLPHREWELSFEQIREWLRGKGAYAEQAT